jgi:hypothetical protein
MAAAASFVCAIDLVSVESTSIGSSSVTAPAVRRR